MLERTLRILEYQKIIEQLASHASSSLGKEKALSLRPSYDFQEIKKWQDATEEAVKAYRLKGVIPLGGIKDVRQAIKRANIGGMLSPSELLDISSVLYATKNIEAFLVELEEENEANTFPYLLSLREKLTVLSSLEKDINLCIDDNGELFDHASPKLKSIRTSIRTAEQRIREKLEGYIRGSYAKMLSDSLITIRNDRYVIPVKQEYRSSFGGIVHDQSSSGQTLFMEPQSVVNLNNEAQELRINEKKEVMRILKELTEKVAEYKDELLQNVWALGEIDFAFAKAFYCRAIKATKLELVDEPIADFKAARHPLIDAKSVVANDIEIGKDFSVMVITGPNTGGKTVTLKTLGLMLFMAQSGLQLPVGEGSKVGVFHKIYADIGDEQSIEQSLSTFSSHMVHIVEILKDIDDRTLILFDELGAGTDPQEGAALAMSILDEAYGRGASVVATTHYPELKAYGYNRQGVRNASVEFDVDTLSPTYRLLIGVPGRSNAFEISKRLGLPDYVIEEAKKYMSSESESVENMIAGLEESKKQAELELKDAEHYKRSAEKLHADMQKQMIEYYENKDKMLLAAKEEAEKVVEKSKKEAEAVLEELKKMKQLALTDIKEHELIEAKKRLESAVPNVTLSKKIPKAEAKAPRKFAEGDEVRVLKFDKKGQLLEKASSNEWLVQIGILKTKVKEKDLEYISSPVEKEKRIVSTVKGKDFHVSTELDLRGERYENALIRLEKYIDDALLAGYPRISIIHGHGTGALRTGVQDYLKQHRQVKSYRYGHHNEGGLGVTVVELK